MPEGGGALLSLQDRDKDLAEYATDQCQVLYVAATVHPWNPSCLS